MHTAEITVHCLAKTALDRNALREWLGDMGCAEYTLPDASVGTDSELLVSLAAKRCYKSFEVGLNPNVTKIRTDLAEYLDNVLKSGHGSVAEHVSWTFAVENCTRVFTAEMNRHRAGVGISEQSLRYVRFEDIAYWEPLSIRPNPQGNETLEHKKRLTREAFAGVFKLVQDYYAELVKLWALDSDETMPFEEKKKITSMLRRIIPLGVCTGAVYTLNARALRHIITMRCAPGAEEEICFVVGLIAKMMFEGESKLFGDFQQIEGGFWVPKYRKV